MGSIEKISYELKDFFSKQSILKVLLPLDMVLVFGGAGLILFNTLFARIDIFSGFFGGIIQALVFWGFLLGLILAFANLNLNVLYIGLFLYGATSLYSFLRYIKFFYTYHLVTALIFGGLGYLVFKMSANRGNT